MNYLAIDKTRCTGCRMCESICSIVKEGVLNKAKSRIKVMRRDVVDLNRKVCVQCKNPRCVKACPRNAIVVRNGAVRVLHDLCDGCGACTEVCDRLFLAPDGGTVLMCDQCGSCVPHCPEEALSIKKREVR